MNPLDQEIARARRSVVLRKRVADACAFAIVLTLVACVIIAGWWAILWMLTNLPHNH